MVMNQAQPMFRAISDPTRRAILDILTEEDLPVGDIVSRFRVSQPAISKHLRILRETGLVTERRVGRARVYRLAPDPLRAADDWLAEFRTRWATPVPTLRAWVDARSAGESHRVVVLPDGDAGASRSKESPSSE